MDWKNEAPKVEGYYWFYPNETYGAEVVDFHVNTWKDKPDTYWFLMFSNNETYHPDEYPDAKWAGPLLPPMRS